MSTATDPFSCVELYLACTKSQRVKKILLPLHYIVIILLDLLRRQYCHSGAGAKATVCTAETELPICNQAQTWVNKQNVCPRETV